jgi:hypothetical protein
MACNNIYKVICFTMCVKIFCNVNYSCFICHLYLCQASPSFFPLYMQLVYVRFRVMHFIHCWYLPSFPVNFLFFFNL